MIVTMVELAVMCSSSCADDHDHELRAGGIKGSGHPREEPTFPDVVHGRGVQCCRSLAGRLGPGCRHRDRNVNLPSVPKVQPEFVETLGQRAKGDTPNSPCPALLPTLDTRNVAT